MLAIVSSLYKSTQGYVQLLLRSTDTKCVYNAYNHITPYVAQYAILKTDESYVCTHQFQLSLKSTLVGLLSFIYHF
jgi:hypothetical protein